MFVLHDHQRAGAQVTAALARRCREDRAPQLRRRHAQFLHHRRQFCPQQRLGADPRPPDISARSREAQCRLHHPGGYALPQACQFHREMRAGGCGRVFIGLENINPDNLLGAKKRQNKITEYREMLLAWKAARVVTYAGYILGFPNDTPASIAHDIEVIKRELPVDLLEFFYLTPLPGCEDHRKLVKAGTPLDSDLNRYDLNHVTTAHPRMSREEWEHTYQSAWRRYYTIDHIKTVLRRLASVG